MQSGCKHLQAPTDLQHLKFLGVMQGVLWAWQAYWDALGMVRLSGIKVLRALQTVWRTLVLVCNKVLRHRLTLTIRVKRYWHRTRQKAVQRLTSCWQWCAGRGAGAPVACSGQRADKAE